MRLAIQRREVALQCMPAGMRVMASSSAAVLHSPHLRGSAASQQLPAAQAAQAAISQGPSAATSSTGTSSSSSSSNGSTSRPKVCILGGGFGGLYTAIKLQLLMWPQGKKPQITLVDQSDRFTFKPLLYELLNGTAQAGEVAPTFTQLLAPYPIQFVQDRVLDVQPEQLLQDGGSAQGGNVALASGQLLPYDWLVVSLGAAADPRGVPGVREYATPFITLEDAEFVAGRLAAFEARAAVGLPQATVVVVGAGYAGVELASVVGERLQGKAQVLLITPGPDILESAPAGQREAARQALQACGVTVVNGSKVASIAEQPPPAAVDDGSLYSAAATATATASTSTPFAASPVLAAATVGQPGQTAAASSTASTITDSVYDVQLTPASSTDSSSASSSSSQVTADLVLWTAGSRPVSRPLRPFPTDPRGQLQTEATLQVKGHARVFALGDISQGHPESSGSSSGQVYPATAQVAFQQADYAAWNIWSAINGRSLLPFRYQHLGDMMSLGAANAAVALPFQLPSQVSSTINSSPLGPLLAAAGIKLTNQQQQQQSEGAAGITLDGPLAQLLRRAAYLYRQPTQEQRLQVAANWLNQAADAAARLAAEAGSATNSSSRSSS